MKDLDSKFNFISWDSKFFGYGVYKIFSFSDRADIELQISEIREKSGKLIYIFLDPADSMNAEIVKKQGGILVDKKVTYQLKINANFIISNSDQEIEKYLLSFPNEDLIQLALESGKYSRFKLDKNFENNEFFKLYNEWILKSVTGQISDFILIIERKSKIIAMTTLQKKEKYMDIGLVSVDEKYRGKGYGKKIISGAILEAYKLGYSEMKVVTQEDNISACKLYERMGFEIQKIVHIYHIWLK